MDIISAAEYLRLLADPDTSTDEITALAQKVIVLQKGQDELIELVSDLIDRLDELDKKNKKDEGA